MASIDEQFVEFIVKSLVSNPDEVTIKRTIDEKGVLLELTVDPEDLGRVIGKRGATAQSVRTLLRALGTKNDARYNLKIVDNGTSASYSHSSSSSDNSDDEQPTTSVASAREREIADEEDVTHNIEPIDDDEQESLTEKTRKELNDLDDLEI